MFTNQGGNVMKYKKLLALVLTAGMLGGILSGCMPGSGTGEAASSEPAVESKQETTEGNTVQEADSSENAGGYSLPLCDPGSESLSILTYQNWHASAYYDSDEGLPVENEIEKSPVLRWSGNVLPAAIITQ